MTPNRSSLREREHWAINHGAAVVSHPPLGNDGDMDVTMEDAPELDFGGIDDFFENTDPNTFFGQNNAALPPVLDSRNDDFALDPVLAALDRANALLRQPISASPDSDPSAISDAPFNLIESLPAELQNKICNLLFVEEAPIYVHWKAPKPTDITPGTIELYSVQNGMRSWRRMPKINKFPTAFLATNKYINNLATSILYGGNSYIYSVGKHPVNHLPKFLGPLLNPYTMRRQPRDTTRFLRDIKIVDLSGHKSLSMITNHIQTAAESGEKMALQRLTIRSLSCTTETVVSEVGPMLLALRKLKGPDVSLEETGVLDLLWLDTVEHPIQIQIDRTEKHNRRIRKALKKYLEREEQIWFEELEDQEDLESEERTWLEEIQDQDDSEDEHLGDA